VCQIKKHIGNKVTKSSLPQFQQASTLQPQAILDRRM
jgi:hypothetical protein